MNNYSASSLRLRRLVAAAVFVAVAYLCRFLLHFNVMFLTFELKDAILAIGAMYLGPLWGVLMAAVLALLELATLSDTGWYGCIMNFLAAASFAGTAGAIYRIRRTMGGAIIALFSGAVALVAVMLPANLLITPRYMGVDVGVVKDLIPTLLLPFNAIKGLVNMGVVMLLYKSVSRAITKSGLLPPRPSCGNVGTKTVKVPMMKLSLCLLAVAMLVFFAVLQGSFSFGK